VWPRDKPRWLARVRSELALPPARVAAVGDSPGDSDLLAAAGLRFFVGHGAPPRLPGVVHRRAGDVEQIAREVLARWVAP
jgi:phosphoserine phosphatase